MLPILFECPSLWCDFVSRPTTTQINQNRISRLWQWQRLPQFYRRKFLPYISSSALPESLGKQKRGQEKYSSRHFVFVEVNCQSTDHCSQSINDCCRPNTI